MTAAAVLSCPMLDEMYPHAAGGRADRAGSSINVGALSTPSTTCTMLRALMLERRPARTLEVGLELRRFGADHRRHPSRARAACRYASTSSIDPFQGTVWDNAALAALDRAGSRLRRLPGATLHRSALAALAAERRRSVSSTSTARTCSKTSSSTPISASACCRTGRRDPVRRLHHRSRRQGPGVRHGQLAAA